MSDHNDNARLETFCDGVIAIAITLLILEIKVPTIESVHSINDLWQHLFHDWSSWFAFALSFGTILIAWVNHHNLFKLIGKSNSHFVYANGFFLFTLAILPFPTALMAEYIQTPYAQAAITLYCFSALFHNIGWNVLSITVVPLAKNEEALKNMMLGVKNTRMGFFLYLFIFLLSFWFPTVALTLICLSWLSWVVIGININPGKK